MENNLNYQYNYFLGVCWMVYSISISVDKTTVNVNEPIHVSGRFTEDGNPVADATVELYVNDAKVYETVTDELGNYIFELTFTKAGRYDIYVVGVEPGVPTAPEKPPEEIPEEEEVPPGEEEKTTEEKPAIPKTVLIGIAIPVLGLIVYKAVKKGG